MEASDEDLNIIESIKGLSQKANELLNVVEIADVASRNALQEIIDYRHKLAEEPEFVDYKETFDKIKTAISASGQEISKVLDMPEAEVAGSSLIKIARDWMISYNKLCSDEHELERYKQFSGARSQCVLYQESVDISAVLAVGKLLTICPILEDLKQISTVFNSKMHYAYLIDEISIYLKSFNEAIQTDSLGHVANQNQVREVENIEQFVSGDLVEFCTRYKKKLTPNATVAQPTDGD